jgi:hypothetical protein
VTKTAVTLFFGQLKSGCHIDFTSSVKNVVRP